MPTLEQTSVPPWAVEAVAMPLDLAAAHVVLITFAPDRLGSTEWEAELERAQIPCEPIDLSGASKAENSRAVGLLVGSATVGVRLMLHGPLAPVLAARAVALDHGLLDEEIIVGTTDVARIPLYCVHCTAESVVTAAIGDIVACVGCGIRLLVHHHVSRRQGAFLGFKNDADVFVPSSPEAVA